MHDVVDAWRKSEERGEPAVLATVVRVQGSGYRRPGARLLLTANGETVGERSAPLHAAQPALVPPLLGRAQPSLVPPSLGSHVTALARRSAMGGRR